MPRVKSENDEDYVDSSDTEVHTHLHKYQTVTIDMNQSAVVMDPVPNLHGEVLVQIMKWVPLSEVETKVSSSGRRSSRTKHRPGYLVEDKSFFALPDSKYASNAQQNVLTKGENLLNKGAAAAGSRVTQAFVHDTIKGIFYNVPFQTPKFNRSMKKLKLEPSDDLTKNYIRSIVTKVDCSNSADSSVSKEKSSNPSYEMTDSFDSSDDEAYLPTKRLRTSLT